MLCQYERVNVHPMPYIHILYLPQISANIFKPNRSRPLYSTTTILTTPRLRHACATLAPRARGLDVYLHGYDLGACVWTYFKVVHGSLHALQRNANAYVKVTKVLRKCIIREWF